MTFNDLLTTITKKKLPHNLQQLQTAYDFAASIHQDQIRHTGEPLIYHPLGVAQILARWGQPQTTIIAALLHETLESDQVNLDLLSRKFGSEIAFLVNGVTRLGQVQLRHSTDHNFVENLRKMFVAMAQDIRVVIIRLADRLHNMQTLDAIPRAKHKRIAQETLEIYAPLAERLGMGKVKGQLEDLSFPFVYPKESLWLDKLTHDHFAKGKKLTQTTLKKLKRQLKSNAIIAQVHGRLKHKYSLYKKLLRPGIDQDITKIADLVAFRVITASKADCYAALGVIHQYWTPSPHHGVSDFIAQPKPNGYQSIHTKVFDRHGHIIEIQIRTQAMHQHAEHGAAAHFAYAEAKTTSPSDTKLDKLTSQKITQKMHWVQQLAAWQQEVVDSDEFSRSLKLDALSHRIYVFSPLGDVYDLPVGATPVDFAYAVHTQLINYLHLAKVNQRVVPLDHSLNSGDVVEIIKSKTKRRPSPHWLKFVKTTRARALISKILNKASQNQLQ